MKKGITIVVILIGLITPLTTPNANAQDIVGTALSLGKLVNGAVSASQNAGTISQLKNLIEDLVCMKSRFDAKFSAGLNASNCLFSAKIKLINVQYSIVYSQAISIGISTLTSSNGATQMSDLIRSLTALTATMRGEIAEDDYEKTEVLLNKQSAKDYSTVLATSF